MPKSKIVIGRQDVADFPLLNLEGIAVKVDTGAYTSSFHCHDIEEIKREGESFLRCKFLDPEHPKFHDQAFLFDEYRFRRVKSSNGQIEERFSIETELLLFERKYSIELTLTERGSMRFPVLLGRKFLKRHFIVDAAKKNLSYKGKLYLFPPPQSS